MFCFEQSARTPGTLQLPEVHNSSKAHLKGFSRWSEEPHAPLDLHWNGGGGTLCTKVATRAMMMSHMTGQSCVLVSQESAPALPQSRV